MALKIAMANAVLPTSQLAGVSLQVHGLANELVARGHEVRVFSCSTRPADARYQVMTFPVSGALPRRLYSYVQAFSLARQDFRAYDVVHAHGDNYLLARCPAQVRTFHGAAKAEARVATRISLKAYYTFMAPLEMLGSRMSAYNVGVSEATREDIGRIDEIVPCGIDLSRFRPGAKSEKPTILFVGGLTDRKRGYLLVEHFRATVHPALAQAELWLVSGQRVDAEGVVNFGNVSGDRLAELYRQAWLFCMPSSYEGFGVPYIEAMASATAVVATPNRGACEVLGGGRYGALVADDDLGLTLLELLTEAQSRAQLTNSSIERVQLYGWGSVAAAYERIYERVREARPNFARRFTRRVPAHDNASSTLRPGMSSADPT